MCVVIADNGAWFDSVLKASPQTKYLTNLVGFVMAFALFMYVFITLPFTSQMKDAGISLPETAFWVWWVSFAVNEASQWAEFGSFGSYMAGSGNMLDMLLNLVFFLAAVCRVTSFYVPDEVQLYLHPMTSVFFMCNLFGCTMRLLTMFSASRRLGIIKIVFIRILKLDVFPFLLYLLVVMVTFEVGSQIFAWSREVELAQRSFGYTLFSFSEPLNGIRSVAELDSVTLESQLGVGHIGEASTQIRICRELFNIAFFTITLVSRPYTIAIATNHACQMLENPVRRRYRHVALTTSFLNNRLLVCALQVILSNVLIASATSTPHLSSGSG